jgi:hypothetical protein
MVGGVGSTCVGCGAGAATVWVGGDGAAALAGGFAGSFDSVSGAA